MKIVKVEWTTYQVKNKEPFRIAYGVSLGSTNVFVKIVLEDGTVGYGEACGSRKVTGETASTITCFVKDAANLLVGEDIYNLTKIIEKVYGFMKGNTAAKAAIDLALHDAWAKVYGVPLFKALGGKVKNVETDYTIGIKDISSMCREAKNFVEKGFTKLKIKVGVTPQEDIEIVKKIREEVGYDIELRVDANQAWDPKTAVKVINAITRYEIEFVEQPVPWWDLNGLKYVKDRVDVKIMADESVLTSKDALKVVKMEAVDLINIKLMKCGGLREAMKIANIAEAAGVKCMVGCMNETSLSIAAAAHLAAATPNIVYCDLDSPLMIVNDPAKPPLKYIKGVIELPENKGIGIDVENVFKEQ